MVRQRLKKVATFYQARACRDRIEEGWSLRQTEKKHTHMSKVLSKKEYKAYFKNKKKRKAALKRAWLNRDFEIQYYWKRATYFWAFIASAFAGYIALLAGDNFEQIRKYFPQLEYLLICLGFIFSFAWLFVNYGSKSWQENWEKHIVELEDKETGPIYKVVLNQRIFSVSKINLVTNYCVILIWILLAIHYLNKNICFCNCDTKPDWIIILSTIGSIIAVLIMILYGGKIIKSSSGSYYSFIYNQKKHKK